jgi:hypothetical protein
LNKRKRQPGHNQGAPGHTKWSKVLDSLSTCNIGCCFIAQNRHGATLACAPKVKHPEAASAIAFHLDLASASGQAPTDSSCLAPAVTARLALFCCHFRPSLLCVDGLTVEPFASCTYVRGVCLYSVLCDTDANSLGFPPCVTCTEHSVPPCLSCRVRCVRWDLIARK